MGIFDTNYNDLQIDLAKKKSPNAPAPAPVVASSNQAAPAMTAQAINTPPIAQDSPQPPLTPSSPMPAMPTPPGIAANMAQNPNAAVAPATIADIPRPANQAQVMRQSAPVASAAPSAVQPSAPAAPDQPQTKPWYAGADSRDERTGLEMERARRDVATQAGVMSDPIKSAVQFGVVGSPSVASVSAQPASGNNQPTPTSPISFGSNGAQVGDGISQLPSSGMEMMTGKATYDKTGNKTGMANPDSSGGGFTQGNTSYNVNPTSQEGIAKVTAQGKNPLYTNINPEQAIAGLKNQTIGGDPQEGIARMARANATRQEMIDAQPVGGGNILPDQNAIDNAEKTARWRQDDLVYQARQGNQAAIASIINANSAAATEASRANTEAGKTAVAARGQDLQAKSDAAKIAGNPNDNQLKIAQAGGIAATTDSAKMIADIQRKAIGGDVQALAVFRSLTGKEPKAASDRYLTVPGGEETGPDGMTKIKRPSEVFDAQTGQMVQRSGPQGQQQQAPASAVEYLKKNPSQAAAFKAKYGYTPEGF